MDRWVELTTVILNMSEFRMVRKPKKHKGKWVVPLTYKIQVNNGEELTITCSNQVEAESCYNKIKSVLLNNPIHSSKFME